MSKRLDPVETILVLTKQMESTVLGLRELGDYVDGVASLMVGLLIEDGEAKIADIKRKLVQPLQRIY